METVTMRSPEGEIRQVEATVEALSPLMAHGWVQVVAEADHTEEDARDAS